MPFNHTGPDAYGRLATYVSNTNGISLDDLVITTAAPIYTRRHSIDLCVEGEYLVIRNPANDEVLGKIQMESARQINENELIDILEQ